MMNSNKEKQPSYSVVFLLVIGILSLITSHDFSSSRGELNLSHLFLFITFIPGIVSAFALMNPITILVAIFQLTNGLIKKRIHVFDIYFYVFLFIGAMFICNFPSTFNTYNKNNEATQYITDGPDFIVDDISHSSFGISTISIYYNREMNGRNFCRVPQYVAKQLIIGRAYTIQKTFITRQCSYIGYQNKNIYLFEYSYLIFITIGAVFLYIANFFRKKRLEF